MATTKKEQLKGIGSGNHPNSRKGTANLKPSNTVSKEKARENGRKGAIKSAQVKNMKKDAREAAQNALYSLLINDAGKKALKAKGLVIDENADLVGLSALMGGLLAEGIKGNAQCAKLLLETADALDHDVTLEESESTSGIVMIPEVKGGD